MYKFLLILCAFLSALAYASLRDPTSPNCYNTAKTPILLKTSDSTSAVSIGNRYLKVGDTYIGAKVTKITAHAVYLQGTQGDFNIPISRFDIKQPAAIKEPQL